MPDLIHALRAAANRQYVGDFRLSLFRIQAYFRDERMDGGPQPGNRESHVPMLWQPDKVAAVILDATNNAGDH